MKLVVPISIFSAQIPDSTSFEAWAIAMTIYAIFMFRADDIGCIGAIPKLLPLAFCY
jgi:hypothetical protein